MNFLRCVAVLCLSIASLHAQQQDPSLAPHLYLSLDGIAQRKALAEHEPWAKADLAKIVAQADSYPQAYLTRFGLTKVEAPPTAQWMHWYVCPDTGTELKFSPPNHNICPDTGKDYQDYPIRDVHYHFEHDMLEQTALALAIAYRMTDKPIYAQHAAEILKMYADKYKDYVIVDNYGKQTDWGAHIYTQTLNESIWLIDMTFAYDLVRATLPAADRAHIENDLLLPSAATVVRGHKEPTLNIQSWINGAQASVGFELGRKELIDEAINGPLGFRYQMKNYVHEGFWLEGAWGYQFYAMRPLVATAEMAKKNCMDLWTREPKLASMFLAPLGVVMPDGNLPAFNDSHEVKLFPNASLYELAYRNTHDPRLLAVLDHAPRISKESLLFGVPDLPKTDDAALKSAVFPESGFAMLRGKHTDLSVITKFGEHGGGHGHYDKLGEIIYANGRIQAVDPGTQLYGMALHKEWDQMTVAHNTLSADELRQDAATGKLIAWKDEPGYTAVTVSAGPAYKFADLTRSILVTDEYILQLDRAQSTDGKEHRFDWTDHNFGKQTMALPTTQYDGFPKANGYQHLSAVERGETSADIASRFDNDGTAMNLQLLAAPHSEVFRGVGPGPDPRVLVPFVIVRRKGLSAEFVSLLVPSKGTTPNLAASRKDDGTLTVRGPGWVDTIHLGETLSFHRESSK